MLFLSYQSNMLNIKTSLFIKQHKWDFQRLKLLLTMPVHVRQWERALLPGMFPSCLLEVPTLSYLSHSLVNGFHHWFQLR